jgi:REP element-mobilizing transposase RayT
VITNKGQKTLNVNGVEDHVHLLIGLKPSIALSDLIRDVKNNSSKFINENKLTPKKFEWQSGYGAFSCSPSHLKNAYRYIENQENHHLKQSFEFEYKKVLQDYEVDFKDEYLFDKQTISD